MTRRYDPIEVARDTPWIAWNELVSRLLTPVVRLQFAMAGIAWGRDWRFYGLPIIQKHRRSTLQIGDHLSLRSGVRSNPLGPTHPVILSTRRPGARLIIGSHFGMTGGSIVCEDAITIGDRVTVGANTTIVDTDFHPLDPTMRLNDPSDGATSPVRIGDDVFIGMNCLILKGVAIGARSVIGAGSVVVSEIPPDVIAAGVPARVIRPL